VIKDWPNAVRGLFWDVDPASLEADAQRNFVLDRVLEYGGIEAVRWAEATYGLAGIREYFAARGDRVLSQKTRAFWHLVFFRERSFLPQQLLAHLPTPLRVLQEERDTLTVELRGVKASFFGYPHALIKPAATGPAGFTMADVPDIAAMKLAAIAGRGSRRDFVDVYCICRQCFPLKVAFQFLQAKFPAHQYDLCHILRSLTYFADAEAEPMPVMRVDITWEEVKQFFASEVARLR
jgi:hypothetical protein